MLLRCCLSVPPAAECLSLDRWISILASLSFLGRLSQSSDCLHQPEQKALMSVCSVACRPAEFGDLLGIVPGSSWQTDPEAGRGPLRQNDLACQNSEPQRHSAIERSQRLKLLAGSGSVVAGRYLSGMQTRSEPGRLLLGSPRLLKAAIDLVMPALVLLGRYEMAVKLAKRRLLSDVFQVQQLVLTVVKPQVQTASASATLQRAAKKVLARSSALSAVTAVDWHSE